MFTFLQTCRRYVCDNLALSRTNSDGFAVHARGNVNARSSAASSPVRAPPLVSLYRVRILQNDTGPFCWSTSIRSIASRVLLARVLRDTLYFWQSCAKSLRGRDDLTRETVRNATLLCGLIIATKDNRCYRSYYRKTVLIFGSRLNKSHHHCYFCLAAACCRFSQPRILQAKPSAPCKVTQ